METNVGPRAALSLQVREMVAAIHEALFDPGLNVAALKVRCRIRDNNIASRFKYELGESIKDYINARRLEAARQLLHRPGRPATEIAYVVGFRYPQTFYRAYRRRFGCPPGAGRCESCAEKDAGPSLASEER